MLLTFGTASSLAAAGELNARGVTLPVFPTGSGSASLRRPFDRNLFHVRASYTTEFARLIETLATTGVKTFSVVYQDDAFGKDGLNAVQQKLAELKLEPAQTMKHSRTQQDISSLVPEVKKAQSQIVLLATTATASASFIKRAYETNLTTRIATISDLDPGDLVQVVGADAAKGVMLSQSLPEPSSRRLSMVADFNRLIDAAGGKLPRNALTLEGYIQARVIVEGLRRASSLAPSTLISTYESFKDLNLGGYTITFSAHSHEGAAFVDTAILSSGGRVVR